MTQLTGAIADMITGVVLFGGTLGVVYAARQLASKLKRKTRTT